MSLILVACDTPTLPSQGGAATAVSPLVIIAVPDIQQTTAAPVVQQAYDLIIDDGLYMNQRAEFDAARTRLEDLGATMRIGMTPLCGYVFVAGDDNLWHVFHISGTDTVSSCRQQTLDEESDEEFEVVTEVDYNATCQECYIKNIKRIFNAEYRKW